MEDLVVSVTLEWSLNLYKNQKQMQPAFIDSWIDTNALYLGLHWPLPFPQDKKIAEINWKAAN